VDGRKEALERILRAYAVYDPETGYSQGMAFIAGYLFIHMDEEVAFWCFVQLMHIPKINLRELFHADVNTLQLVIDEFDGMMHSRFKKLHKHLRQQDIDASMFVSSWFLTLFNYRFPENLTPLIWDALIERGIIVVFEVGLAIVQHCREILLTLDHEKILPFFNSIDILPMCK
jgi:ecotropic viral integration site 5 protein